MAHLQCANCNCVTAVQPSSWGCKRREGERLSQLLTTASADTDDCRLLQLLQTQRRQLQKEESQGEKGRQTPSERKGDGKGKREERERKTKRERKGDGKERKRERKGKGEKAKRKGEIMQETESRESKRKRKSEKGRQKGESKGQKLEERDMGTERTTKRWKAMTEQKGRAEVVLHTSVEGWRRSGAGEFSGGFVVPNKDCWLGTNMCIVHQISAVYRNQYKYLYHLDQMF